VKIYFARASNDAEISMKTTLFLTFIFSILAFAACQTATADKTAAEIKQISVEQAKTDLAQKPNAQFIDVRTEAEYEGGHATSAAHFPLDALENDLSRLDKNKPVYVICQTGRRSQKGAEVLQKSGFKEIYNISGGTSAWLEAGLPVEK
jgi:rhodanese-related sulfurtransferase